MYAAVAGAAREIATMRALGFRGLPVVVAVMLETMLLALVGGLLGGAIAWLVFNGYTVSTLSSNFSQVMFQFKVSPELLWNGIKWALGHRPGRRSVSRAARCATAGHGGPARGVTMQPLLIDIGLNLTHDSFDPDRARVVQEPGMRVCARPC
jgi:hypothetical protein